MIYFVAQRKPKARTITRSILIRGYLSPDLERGRKKSSPGLPRHHSLTSSSSEVKDLSTKWRSTRLGERSEREKTAIEKILWQWIKPIVLALPSLGRVMKVRMVTKFP